MGPIPAHAGEPCSPWGGRTTRWAYPRTRGGTFENPAEAEDQRGLSPHTRGNTKQRVFAGPLDGPIPAHAGEHRRGDQYGSSSRAYPRTRGGTSARATVAERRWGLSPHTRGNKEEIHEILSARGPIPAHAGEPAIGGDCHA